MAGKRAKSTPTGRRWSLLALALLGIALPTSMARATESAVPSCRAAERFADEPCRGRKARPDSLEAFLARPSLSEWEAQLDLGWGGSDGSSAAPDTISDVRIGRTSREHGDVDLPANRHDWYYELGRTYDLGWRFRAAADRSYRDMCLRELEGQTGLRGVAARANVRLRWVALRTLGIGAWIAHPGPATSAPDVGVVASR